MPRQARLDAPGTLQSLSRSPAWEVRNGWESRPKSNVRCPKSPVGGRRDEEEEPIAIAKARRTDSDSDSERDSDRTSA